MSYAVPMNTAQNDRMSEDLPFGSRAGLSFSHPFPLDGEYTIAIRLTKSVYKYIVNLDYAHELDVRVDGIRVGRFEIGGNVPGNAAPITYSGTIMASKTPIEGEPERGGPFPTQDWDTYRMSADAEINLKIPVKAGRHTVGVSFIEKTWEAEGILQPPLRSTPQRLRRRRISPRGRRAPVCGLSRSTVRITRPGPGKRRAVRGSSHAGRLAGRRKPAARRRSC